MSDLTLVQRVEEEKGYISTKQRYSPGVYSLMLPLAEVVKDEVPTYVSVAGVAAVAVAILYGLFTGMGAD